MNSTHLSYQLAQQDLLSLRALSNSTIQNYNRCCVNFLEWTERYHNCENAATLEPTDILDYIRYLKEDRHLNPRTINIYIAQVFDLYAFVFHKPLDHRTIPSLKYDEKLPRVPSFEEVNTIIESISNPKHKAEIALLYSSGIRVSELCRLTCGDIERSRNRIHISVSKNRSERYAILSEKTLDLLIIYIRTCYPQSTQDSWLFPNRTGQNHICEETVRRVFANALEVLGWSDKGYNLHSLRHAFGLHLYEDGVDLISIKEAMGHKSIRSTEIYLTLGISNGRSVISPYDRRL